MLRDAPEWHGCLILKNMLQKLNNSTVFNTKINHKSITQERPLGIRGIIFVSNQILQGKL